MQNIGAANVSEGGPGMTDFDDGNDVSILRKLCAHDLITELFSKVDATIVPRPCPQPNYRPVHDHLQDRRRWAG